MRVSWSGPSGEPIVTVTLDRPETRNAQSPATWRALAAVGESLPVGTRVVMVRAAGTVFSSGLDLSTFAPSPSPQADNENMLDSINAVDDVQAAELIRGFQGAFTWLRDRDDIISIAVVAGAAVGAGFQLALSCDLMICTEDARFSMRETTLGLVPDLGGTQPLVSTVGYARALDICVTGRWVDASEALALGLATTVVAPESLDTTVDDLAATVLSKPATAVRATKAVLRAALDNEVDSQRRIEREAQVGLLRDIIRNR
ncbi:MAG: enoyl-CoA hydratase/isomerase family protein [Actinobacteria bacterium]|nr:enoyl-CoA hydratase/isomerase family protein [Actinomycetota bacterium]